MRLTVGQYAKALNAGVKDKSHKEIDLAVSNFLKILQRNNQMKLVGKIVEKFSDIWNKENGIVEAEVITRYKIEDPMTKKIDDFLKEKYGAEKVVLKETIDEKIKGGIILKVGDELLDASIERRLLELKKALIS